MNLWSETTVGQRRRHRPPWPSRCCHRFRLDPHPYHRRISVSATGAGQPAVEVSGLEVDYGDGAVLAGVDLEVHHGEAGLLGPSGCGKTTLLRSSRVPCDSARGVIRIPGRGGRQVAGGGTWVAPRIGTSDSSPQRAPCSHTWMWGVNVAFGLGTRNRTESVDSGSRSASNWSVLPGFEKRRPRDLSGGQQQRIAWPGRWPFLPSVVLLDEPFSALDAALRAQVREEVRDVPRSAGPPPCSWTPRPGGGALLRAEGGGPAGRDRGHR